MVARKVKYMPIGNEISVESVFVQAALALDVAAQFAVESKNATEMNNVASNWIEMARGLLAIEESSEEAPQAKAPVGFIIHTNKEKNVSNESQSESKYRVHP